MKLYIERNGSGWGGYYACYLVDLDTKKYSILQNHELMGVINYKDKGKLTKIVELSKSDCLIDLQGNYTKLKDVGRCRCRKTGYVVMDAQQDSVYLVDNNKARLVWSPMTTPYVKTNDESINETLRNIIEEVSRTKCLCVIHGTTD